MKKLSSTNENIIAYQNNETIIVQQSNGTIIVSLFCYLKLFVLFGNNDLTYTSPYAT